MTAVTTPPPEQPGNADNPYGPPSPESSQNPYGGYQVPGQPGPVPPPGQYGAVPYGGYAVQDHPQAMLSLVLGIIGLVVCGIVAPFAWVIGGRAVREIDESGGRLGGRSTANAGRILGIIGTVLIGLGLLFVVFVIIVAIAGASTSP
jgi:hypothetical protein